MRHTFFILGLLLGIAAPVSSSEDEPSNLVEIESAEQVDALGAGTTAAYIDGFHLKHARADGLRCILTALAKKQHIRHLKLRIPNSSECKDEVFEPLRELDSVETLILDDARDWKSSKIFEQVSSMKGLKKVKLAFL